MKNDSVAKKAYAEIRKKILSGQILPGTRLKEDAWAQKLAIGRMAVREALTRLLGESLLIEGEKGGYFVGGLLAHDIEEIRALRQILEIGALELSVQRITPEELLVLDKICEDFTSMSQQGYLAGACEADIKFHEVLMESSGNTKLINIYRMSHIPLFHAKLGKTAVFMNDYQETDVEHRNILQAIKDKDTELAKKIMIMHFKRGSNAVLDL